MSTTISTNNVNIVPQVSSTSSSQNSDGSTSLQTTSDQFLQMLVTQMQNQDPLNPMDNAQMTSQIAQLNTVQGINQLNTTMKSLQAGLQSNMNLQAANLIGSTITAPGSQFALTNGASNFGVDLASSADTVNITIKNQSGNVVRNIAQTGNAGVNTIVWDGKDNAGNTLPNGNYSFAVMASAGGKSVDATNLATDVVKSISMSGNSVKLNTGSLGDVALSDVRKVQ